MGPVKLKSAFNRYPPNEELGTKFARYTASPEYTYLVNVEIPEQ